jgi:SAM-dependent methyltransferase
MTALPRDYDRDPGRFLAGARVVREDVHAGVAARLAAAGARTVLDVGGGTGRLAALLPALGVRCLLLDLSPTMLATAPRPAALADGSRLPVADESVDGVAALYTLYHYDDPLVPVREARRVLRPGGLFVAGTTGRENNPELAHLIPGWGARSTFDAEDAPALVASVFSAAGDRVQTEHWDGPLATLASAEDAASFLRLHRLDEAGARAAARTLALPLMLTKRGCIVYAMKAGRS